VVSFPKITSSVSHTSHRDANLCPQKTVRQRVKNSIFEAKNSILRKKDLRQYQRQKANVPHKSAFDD